MSETILQINFRFEGSKAEYLKAFAEAAAPIAASPGPRVMAVTGKLNL